MEVTLDYLLKGVATISKETIFLPTKDYVTPFINEMKRYTENFVVKVTPSKQSFIHNGEIITAFYKVWIQAILPEEENGYKVSYNMQYILDSNTPAYKFFKGYILSGRTQVVVTQQDYIMGTMESSKEIPNDFKKLLDRKSDINSWLEKLRCTEIINPQQVLGRMAESAMKTQLNIDGQKTKLSPTEIIVAYSTVYMDSLNGTTVRNNKQATLYDLYKIIVEAICNDKDMINVAEKIIVTNQIFKEVICW